MRCPIDAASLAVANFRDRSYAPVSEVFYVHQRIRSASDRVSIANDRRDAVIQTAGIVANQQLCREHYRLTLGLDMFPGATPGQFVHLSPEPDSPSAYRTCDSSRRAPRDDRTAKRSAPMLRRAFSIAGLRDVSEGINLDVIYRVVGAATGWMQSLSVTDRLSLLGPLGNRFPIHNRKQVAWLVAGGVGLPPMLWLVEALRNAGKRAVAFCGAQTGDLLALTLEPSVRPADDARCATLCCPEFAQNDAPVVISTDDGSLGFRGHIGAALAIYHKANPVPSDELVVYTCGPEPLMQFVAEYCVERDIECYACMERAMACGTGLCQSCVVPVRDDTDPDGWRYRLCCTEGPVFNAAEIIWEPIGSG